MGVMMTTEFPSARFPTLRHLLNAVGGYREAHENKKSWLSKIANRSGVSFRLVCAAYYGEPVSSVTRQKLEQAAERDEPKNHAAQLEVLAASLLAKDAAFYQPQIDQLRDLADQLRRQAGM